MVADRQLEAQVSQLTQRLEGQSQKHSQELARLSAEAEELRAKLRKELHRRRDCLQEQKLDSAFIRQVEWRLTGVTEILRNVPKNKGLYSDKFTILGVPDFMLEFFPQGRDTTSLPGYCSLFLWSNEGVRLKYRLRVGSHSCVDEDTFDGRIAHGHSNFCHLEAQVDKESDTVVIGLEVIEVSQTQEPVPGLRLVNAGPEAALSREADVLRNRHIDTVEWRIRDAVRRTKEVPAGFFICSQLFSIAGVRDLQLEFYPNGLEGSKPGFCGFYVRCPSGQYTLNITLFVGSAKKGPSKTEFNGNAAKGLPDFCRLSEQLVEPEEADKVDIKDVICGVIVSNPRLEEEEMKKELYV